MHTLMNTYFWHLLDALIQINLQFLSWEIKGFAQGPNSDRLVDLGFELTFLITSPMP